MEGDAARRHRGELYAALAAMAFGSAYVATAKALEAFAPVPAAAWRSLLAAVVVGGLLALRGGRSARRARRGDPRVAAADGSEPGLMARLARLLALSILAGPVFLASMNLAVAHVGAAIAAFVAGLYAVLAAVIAPVLLPERLTARVLAGFVLAVVGTLLLAELNPATAETEGLAWGVLAATAFALYLVLARRWSGRYRLDGLAVAFANAAVSASALGGALLVVDPASLAPSAPQASALFALAWTAVVAALGPILIISSVRLVPAARSAAFLLLNPVTASILAFIVLGERLSMLQVAGGLLVLLGMAAATIPTRRAAPPAPEKLGRGTVL